jgi:hypothetical protein
VEPFLPNRLTHGYGIDAGLVEREPDGRMTRCALEPQTMRDAAEWLERFREYWEGRLDALADRGRSPVVALAWVLAFAAYRGGPVLITDVPGGEDRRHWWRKGLEAHSNISLTFWKMP